MNIFVILGNISRENEAGHKSLAQPFTNKWTNKGLSKNSTGFSNSVAT